MKQPFNWTDPDAYEIFMGRWSELLTQPFLAFAGVPSGGRVLDVACGTGVLSKALADTGAHVIGVDASEGYLEGAQRRRSHPNITYESGDVRQLRFADNSFDAAVSTLALDVIPEIEQVVTEMKRVTKPGGVVASGVHQFFGGMPAFDLVQHTGAVLDAAINEMRTFFKGRPLFWPNVRPDCGGIWGLPKWPRCQSLSIANTRPSRIIGLHSQAARAVSATCSRHFRIACAMPLSIMFAMDIWSVCQMDPGPFP